MAGTTGHPRVFCNQNLAHAKCQVDAEGFTVKCKIQPSRLIQVLYLALAVTACTATPNAIPVSPTLHPTKAPILTATAGRSVETIQSTPCHPPRNEPPPESRFDPLDGAGAIAYSNDGLRLVYPDSGHTVQLHQGSDTAFVWSPDGDRIAFLSRLRSEPCAFAFLMLADLRAGSIRHLLDRPGLFSQPTWSPDGGYLAYTESDGRLQVLGLSDNLVQVLSDDAYVSKVIDLHGDAVDVVPVAPAWVDETHIAYVKGNESGQVMGLAKLTLDGSESSMLVTGTVNPYDGFAFAPDGTRLAYARSSEGESPLVLVDLRSGERLEIEDDSSNQVRSPASRLQWSPDGAFLAGGAGLAGVYIVQVAPPVYLVSQIKPLGLLGAVQTWAPDSRCFAILVERGAQLTHLAIYDLEKATLGELAVEVHPPYAIAWNPK